jgi:hypothetical protein
MDSKPRADTYTIRYGRQTARTPVPVGLASEQRGRLNRIVVNPAHDVLVGDVAVTRLPKSLQKYRQLSGGKIGSVIADACMHCVHESVQQWIGGRCVR